MTTAVRRWAARQLALGPEASAEEARRALLVGLEDDGFVPPPARQAAYQVFCWDGQAPAPLPTSDPAEEARLREQVEGFASRFFTFPPDRRQQRWQELADRCAL